MDTSTRPIDAQLLVELFNYGSMHRRGILADMEDYSEHISLDTAKDGSEVGYVNHTECFGGTFTGI